MWRALEYSIIMPLAYFYQSFSVFAKGYSYPLAFSFVQVFEACLESKLFHYSHFLSIYTHVRAYWMVQHTSRKAALQLLSCQMRTNSLNHSSESFLAFYRCGSLSFSLLSFSTRYFFNGSSFSTKESTFIYYDSDTMCLIFWIFSQALSIFTMAKFAPILILGVPCIGHPLLSDPSNIRCY